MDDYGCGLWVLFVVNSVIFITFAASFFHPRSGRDWRVMGGFSAFVMAYRERLNALSGRQPVG